MKLVRFLFLLKKLGYFQEIAPKFLFYANFRTCCKGRRLHFSLPQNKLFILPEDVLHLEKKINKLINRFFNKNTKKSNAKIKCFHLQFGISSV